MENYLRKWTLLRSCLLNTEMKREEELNALSTHDSEVE